MLLSEAQLPEVVDLVERVFTETPSLLPEGTDRLFIKRTHGPGQGATKRFTELDTETFAASKPEGEATKKTSVQIGYYKDLVLYRFGIEIDITYEMRYDNKVDEVRQKITDLSRFCPQRKELDLAHVFTYAFSTSYVNRDGETIDTTGGDGLALLSSVHPLKASTDTWTNIVPGNPAFSKGALEGAELLAVTNIKNSYGELRVMEFNKIVTGRDPNLCNTVKQFLNSTTDTTQVNPNTMNIYKNKYEHVVVPHLSTDARGGYDQTKAKYWFLVAAEQDTMGWQCYYVEAEAPNLKTPTPNGSGEDFSRDIWTFGARMRYGIVRVTGRGLIGSTGTGSS